MLPTILTTHFPQFRSLAESWLASGATSFAVWSSNNCLAHWSTNTQSVQSTLVEPIQVGASVIGQLRISGLNGPGAQARLRAEAGFVSHLVHMERDLNTMTSELIDTRDQLLALYDLTQATRNYMEVEQVLSRLAYEASRLVKTEAAFLLLQMTDWPPMIKHYPHSILDQATIESCLEKLKESEGGIWYTDNTGGITFPPKIFNLLLAPIKVRQAVVAAIGVLNKTNGNFESPDIKLTRAIADYAGAQIENILMYQETLAQAKLQTEMELAQRVQLHLLPENQPVVSGLDLWAGNRSASQVGGDFYDFVVKPKQPFMFIVGDISGKGMPAALLMAMTRTMLRTKANVSPLPNPELLLERCNHELYDDFTKVNMFATLFVGQYDPNNRRLLYANAGHSPVIYRPAGGTARLLEADGMPTGILPSSFSRDQQLIFNPGDILLVASDGFTEATNGRQEMFGYERFTRLVDELADLPAWIMAEKLFQAVATFTAGRLQDDDQTLLIMKGKSV